MTQIREFIVTLLTMLFCKLIKIFGQSMALLGLREIYGRTESYCQTRRLSSQRHNYKRNIVAMIYDGYVLISGV